MYLNRISLAKVKKSIKNNKKELFIINQPLVSFPSFGHLLSQPGTNSTKRFTKSSRMPSPALCPYRRWGLIQSAPAHTMNDTFSSIILHSSASDRVLKTIDRLILRPAPCEAAHTALRIAQTLHLVRFRPIEPGIMQISPNWAQVASLRWTTTFSQNVSPTRHSCALC